MELVKRLSEEFEAIDVDLMGSISRSISCGLGYFTST